VWGRRGHGCIYCSTAAYKTSYGSENHCPNNDDKLESESESESYDSIEEDEGAGDYMRGESDDSWSFGIEDAGSILLQVDIDDEDYVDADINSELEDGMHSLFPSEKNPSKNLKIGGPQARSTKGMTAVEAKLTRKGRGSGGQISNIISV
jgi:hypothetical protein